MSDSIGRREERPSLAVPARRAVADDDRCNIENITEGLRVIAGGLTPLSGCQRRLCLKTTSPTNAWASEGAQVPAEEVSITSPACYPRDVIVGLEIDHAQAGLAKPFTQADQLAAAKARAERIRQQLAEKARQPQEAHVAASHIAVGREWLTGQRPDPDTEAGE